MEMLYTVWHMNIQSQKGFIPLIALIIALLSIGGGVAAYEVHKQKEEAKIETQTSDDANTTVPQKGETSTTQENTSPREHTTTQPVVAVQTSTKATTALNIDRKYEREEEDEEEDEDDEGGRSTTVQAPVTNPAVASTFYTMAQIKTHNSRTSCWTAVYGGVYDVSAWISQHPGGSGAILGMCGVDGTSAFDAQHGGQSRANAELGSFKIGVLK